MGRRQHLDVLALGRSAYEPLEVEPRDPVTNPFSAVSDRLTADGHVQCYDLHGYPTNPLSKRRKAQLRRSQSDILDAMGFVITSAGVRALKSRRHRKRLLSVENDCGLAFALCNEVFMSFSAWWSESLRRRLQTFRGYGQSSVTDLIRSEWREMGLLSISSSGLPVWVTTFLLSVCEGWLRESIEDYVDGAQHFKTETRHFVARVLCGGFSACAQACFNSIFRQGIAISLLQTLHLIPLGAVPSLRSLIPFGESSLVKFPPVPASWTLSSFWQFARRFLQGPIVTGYLLQSLRPLIASRIHHIIWRRLPKPDRPDALSLAIAKQNGVTEWTLPSVGDKVEEERARSRLSLTQELLYELRAARDYLLSWLNLLKSPSQEQDDLELMHFAPSTRRTSSQQRRRNEDPARQAMIRRRRARRFSSESIGEDRGRQREHSHLMSSSRRALSVGGSEPASPERSPRVRASIVRQEIDSHHEVTIQLELVDTQSTHHADAGEENEDGTAHRSTRRSSTSERRQHLLIELTNQYQPSTGATHHHRTGLAAEPLFPSVHEHEAAAATEQSMYSMQPSRPDAGPDDDRRARLASLQESINQSNSAARRRKLQHRVTVLSSQPVDSLAYHLAFVVTDIILSPLEALYLRNIARNFLSSSAGVGMTARAANMMGSSTSILSTTEWFGGGSLPNRLSYAAKILMIWGFETVIGIGVWGGSLWLTTFLGKKKFGWGRL